MLVGWGEGGRENGTRKLYNCITLVEIFDDICLVRG